MTPDAWEHALELGSEYDFLMNAILCISARHLAVLLPEDLKYPAAAATHLCQALVQFRQELSGDFTSTHIDAFIATSVLLQFEIWTNTESIQDGSFRPFKDPFFSFSASLKEVFLKALPLLKNQTSVFLPHFQQSPIPPLQEAAQISTSTAAAYQDFFSCKEFIGMGKLKPPPHDRGGELASLWEYGHPEIDGFEPIINHICLILSFLPEAAPGDVKSFLPYLTKYIVSFPVIVRGFFPAMVHQCDPHALVLLYHFYRAVRILLPLESCWWARNRAIVSEIVLKDWLTMRCTDALTSDGNEACLPVNSDLRNPFRNQSLDLVSLDLD